MTDKPFKTLDQQVAILKKRGLSIQQNKVEEVKGLLLRSNYYDIVNGYASFLQSNTNKFIEGSDFFELYSIYMYDKNIKSLFFRKIQKAEAFIRSAIAYHFSKNHQENWAYLHTGNFSDKPLEVARLFSSINQCITRNGRFKNNAISHYLDRKDPVPLWVVINFFELGLTRTFLKLMRDKDKLEIVIYINSNLKKYYGFDFNLVPSDIDSYLENIHSIRNIVAHDNRLLKFENIKKSRENKAVDSIFNNVSRKSVFHVYLTLRLFLSDGQFENFTKALRSRTKDLRKKLHSIEVQEVLDSISFPREWMETSFSEIFHKK